MKCSIFGPNVKFFGRCLNSLAKIGEDLYLEAQPDGLALRTTSSSRSAFMCYLLHPSFFFEYILNGSEDDDGTDNTAKETHTVAKCKLSMKAILMAFRSISSLDKTVESCTISIAAKESKTKIELRCKFSVVKTYTLPFIECETIKARYNAKQGSNHISAQAKVLTEVALNFLSKQEEVTMSVDDSKFTMKNFVENEEDSKRMVHTELSMTPAEFERYNIAQKSTVTFCLKELRAFISFADACNLPVSFCFDTGGNPIVFTTVNPEVLEGILIMATLDGENEDPQPVQQNQQATTQSATNMVVASSSGLSQRPSGPSEGSQSNLRHSQGGESQASVSFLANGRRSEQNRRPSQVNSSDKPETPGASGSIFSGPNFSLAGSLMGPPVQTGSLVNVMEGSQSRRTAEEESQASLVFRSKRHLPRDSRTSKRVYNNDTDSSDDEDHNVVNQSQSKNVAASNHSSQVSANGDFSQHCRNHLDVDGTLPDVELSRFDVIDGTPPSKRAKVFFQRCFDATFNPSMITGVQSVLAPDSDGENS